MQRKTVTEGNAVSAAWCFVTPSCIKVKMLKSLKLAFRNPSNARVKSRKTVRTGRCRASHPLFSIEQREKEGIGTNLLLLQTGHTGWALTELWQLLSSVQVLRGRNEPPEEQPLNLIYVCPSPCAHADLCPSGSTHLWLPAEVWGSKYGPVSVSCQSKNDASDFVRDPG